LENLYLKKLSISKENLINIFFNTGLFLLPSAFSISAFFLLISLILNSSINEEKLLDDNFNIYFFFGSIYPIIFNEFLELLLISTSISLI